ncbi:hypothetical protein AN478_09335 [Thiohalorhabdus denitrificans]|uniref:Uncharacterized protein n=1 Tax=Thiohalorhabdus denitrificans TaxID=381306 RepID=A0A0P9EDA0_9GAMM|nr:hypothetical protein [Thiohalorhabdus denitrificans]KPV40288.1 hypothetical protein AN478_09335 [Thiohalorhabdus denitrificans]SCX81157.1 hypothetical protein SAMN05661077_0537 [Thiohalorhabdus denitrificans]
MQRRFLQKGLLMASKWAVKAAREGFQVPIPQSVLDNLLRRMDDPSVRDLHLKPAADNRVELSGMKKVGVWVEFRAVFRLDPPAAEEPGQSLALALEKADPFFARNALLGALEEVDGVHVHEERVLVDLGNLIEQHQWGRKVPRGLRDRLRIADVSTQEGRINLRVGVS